MSLFLELCEEKCAFQGRRRINSDNWIKEKREGKYKLFRPTAQSEFSVHA
jgi:hypothetical protein